VDLRAGPTLLVLVLAGAAAWRPVAVFEVERAERATEARFERANIDRARNRKRAAWLREQGVLVSHDPAGFA
jgi:hypothetical protein